MIAVISPTRSGIVIAIIHYHAEYTSHSRGIAGTKKVGGRGGGKHRDLVLRINGENKIYYAHYTFIENR